MEGSVGSGRGSREGAKAEGQGKIIRLSSVVEVSGTGPDVDTVRERLLPSGFSSPQGKVALDAVSHVRCSMINSVLREGRTFSLNTEFPRRHCRGSKGHW